MSKREDQQKRKVEFAPETDRKELIENDEERKVELEINPLHTRFIESVS